jgi:hydroxylamine reductase (hybrid-cluster protein)
VLLETLDLLRFGMGEDCIVVDTKCVPMPTHLGALQDRVKQESSRFPKPQQASLDKIKPRRASQFYPVIDKGKENVKSWNLSACYQTVLVYVAIR